MNAVSILPQDARFLGLEDAWAAAESAGVVILSVPFERTSTYGQGSALGPAAVLTASQQVELFDAALGFEPHVHAGGIATLAPLDVSERDACCLVDRLRDEVSHWLDAGKLVVTLGGEHTSVVGAIRAHCEYYEELTVLQLDAHSDLREEYLDDPWNHACAMARVLEFHPRVVQVGIRSQASEEREMARARELPVIYGHEIAQAEREGLPWLDKVIDALGDHVYITFDCDVMDPAAMPATGTPEPGGLTWNQVDALLARLCRERAVVGFDVSELVPIAGLTYPEFTVAKLVNRLIGYRFASEPRKGVAPGGESA